MKEKFEPGGAHWIHGTTFYPVQMRPPPTACGVAFVSLYRKLASEQLLGVTFARQTSCSMVFDCRIALGSLPAMSPVVDEQIEAGVPILFFVKSLEKWGASSVVRNRFTAQRAIVSK